MRKDVALAPGQISTMELKQKGNLRSARSWTRARNRIYAIKLSGRSELRGEGQLRFYTRRYSL